FPAGSRLHHLRGSPARRPAAGRAWSPCGHYGPAAYVTSNHKYQKENAMEALKDASHLYAVERRDEHAARPGFRISELQISPTQKVPWHFHTNVQDTFYVIHGQLRLF